MDVIAQDTPETSRPHTINGEAKLKADRMARVVNAIEWSQVCLNEAKKDFNEHGKSTATTMVREIINELTNIRGALWNIFQQGNVRIDYTAPPFGGFPQYPASLDEETRTWIDGRMDEIKKIITETVGLVESRGDFDEFPSRTYIIPGWTQITSRYQRAQELPECPKFDR